MTPVNHDVSAINSSACFSVRFASVLPVNSQNPLKKQVQLNELPRGIEDDYIREMRPCNYFVFACLIQGRVPAESLVEKVNSVKIGVT